MTLEGVIHDAVQAAVTDAVSKQLAPLLQPILQKLKITDINVDADELFTRPEAARFLKVSPITMSIWAHEKRGPEMIRLGSGRGVRYRRSALEAFLQRNHGLVGKKGRPSKAEIEAVTVTTSGLTTGRVKKTIQKGGLAQAGK